MGWTSDGGFSWHDASTGLPSGDGASSIASIGNILLCGTTYNYIFFSSDSGASWQQSNWLNLASKYIPALIAKDSFVFASNNGVIRSSDSGRNWAYDTSSLLPLSLQPVFSFAKYDSLLLAGTEAEYILRTTNDGNSWDTVRLTTNRQIEDVVRSLAVVGKTVLAGTSGGLYRSSDLGLTWKRLDTSLFYHGPLSLVTVNGIVIAGMEYTVVSSKDYGLTWQSFDEGWPPGVDPSSLIEFDNYIFAGSEIYGLFRRPLSDIAVVNPAPVLSQHSNALEIYDVLGRLLYRGTPAEKPQLPGGFYFECTGSAVRKVWVP